MRASKYLAAVLFMALVVVMSSGFAVAGPDGNAAPGGNAAEKATGSGTWTNGQGLDFYAEFNAHEAAGKRAAKGRLLQSLVSGEGGFVVDVDTVTVYDGHACFGGYTTDAWGEFANRLNQYRWTVVADGGEPGDDYLRGGWTGTSQPSWCTDGNTAANKPFSSGNVQIHYRSS